MFRKSLIAVASVAVILGGTATALAVTTTSSGGVVYHGCEGGKLGRSIYDVFSNGNVPKCPSGAWPISWNQTGPQGPQGPAGPAGKNGLAGPTESVRSCTPDLCIDDAPAPDGSSGSGGWGWNNSANAPVTSLAVGDASDPLTVTVLQPNTETADGDITVTYNPYDFSLVSESDGTCTTLNGNTEACTYTDLAHSAKSVSFGFKPLHANPDAIVTATVDVNGEQATAQFPVAITS